MKSKLYLITLLVLSGLVCMTASAETISISPVTLAPGAEGTCQLILESAPLGLSGYQLVISTDNPGIATITGVSFPEWASLSEAEPKDGGYAVRAIDLNSKVEAGATQIQLATMTIKALTAGTAQVQVSKVQMDDDSGNQITAQITPGIITVSGGESPTSVPTQAPSSVEFSLVPGWNLINIPMQPAAGSETAIVFKDVPSAGHSILTYDPAGGWITLGKDDLLVPMTGYWIYTTNPMKITQQVSGAPATPKRLAAGWNLAGIPGTLSQPAESALSGLSSWSYVVVYDSAMQQYREATIKGSGSSGAILTPTEGFWIYLDAEGQLI